MKKNITEEMNIHKEWYEEAKKMTVEKLPEFINKLTNNYGHDYGTICHAISASSIAVAHAINNSPQGGITGFQAGCVMWGFIKNWMPEYQDTYARIVDFKNLLFPQYEEKFTSISKDCFEWLQKEVQKELNTPRELISEKVYKHWQSIVAGKVPFGLKVSE